VVYQNLTGYFIIMGGSALLVLASMIAISRRERSWINWYTLPVAGLLSANYILPAIFLWNFGIHASYFAFCYCYATYAFVSVATATGYLFLKPIRLRRRAGAELGRIRLIPWVLLLLGFLLYLPVLIEFRSFLLQPREIYIRTRTGYGINFFGSTFLINLAFITYLFKQRKSVVGSTVLMATCAALVYLHGSKGQLIVMVFIAVVYLVYMKGVKVTLTSAMLAGIAGSIFVGLLFFAFGSATSTAELVLQMASYSDYTKNAMMVIDDPNSTRYLGQIEAEDEFYSRVPRLLVPNKRKDFGTFRLALKYFPAWFYGDTGSPAFGIGEQYADFGAFSIVVLCLGGLMQGWFARSAVHCMRSRPSVGAFIVLLFFAGIGIFPLGTGYLLPESLLTAALINFIVSRRLRHRFITPPPTTTMAANATS
jgi:hypothetical protein